MVTCGRQPFNMLPMAPINPFVVGLTPSSVAAAAAAAAAAVAASTVNTTTTTVTSSPSAVTKPRIAFSIDSIVGKEANQKRNIPSPSLSLSQRSESPEPLERSPSRSSYSADLQRGSLELRSSDLPTQRGVIFCRRRASLDRSPLHSRGSVSPPLRRSRSRSPLVAYNRHGEERTPSTSPIPLSQQPHSPQLAVTASLNSVPSPPSSLSLPTKGPILVPGIPAGLLRPLPLPPAPNIALVAPPPPNSTTSTGSTESSAPTSQHLPGGHLHQSSSLPPPPPHGIQTHPPPPPNPHFLAAQFQMAAALAHHHHQQQQQQQHPGAHLPPGHPMGIFPPGPHHPHFGGPHLIRDSYPLYPWLLSRHGRIFPHRFPGNFLLQPFRKPKRVRTAFSPTQLLKLEHAFEGNHYVVGAERKQLAQGLSLTETQVKVWFQNRRTKHKRMQQEDGDTKSNKGSQAGDTEGKNDSSQNSFEDQEEEEDDEEIEDEDEVIDMDDYGSEIDAEEHQRIREQFQQQLQQHHQQIQQHMQQQQQHLQQREHQSQREQLQQRSEQQQQQSQHQQQQQQQQLLQQQQHHHFMQQQYFLQQQQQQQQQQQKQQQ